MAYVELRLVIDTEATDTELDNFIEDTEKEIKETLVEEEKVLCSLYTRRISYESRQLLNEMGVNNA